jgi:hypothetical protein
MIWNHSMPPEARTHDYIQHTFTAEYTEEYMQEAIKELAIELNSRDDITMEQLVVLENMAKYLKGEL